MQIERIELRALAQNTEYTYHHTTTYPTSSYRIPQSSASPQTHDPQTVTEAPVVVHPSSSGCMERERQRKPRTHTAGSDPLELTPSLPTT